MLTLPLKQSNSNETVAGKMIINISTNFSQPTTTTGLSAPSSSTPRVSADTPTHPRSDSIRKNTNRTNPTGASSSSSSPLSSFEDNLGPLPAGYIFFIINYKYSLVGNVVLIISVGHITSIIIQELRLGIDLVLLGLHHKIELTLI